MKFRTTIILFVTTLLILSHFTLVLGATHTHFSILYTNDVMGEVEPCG